jgi:adenylate kinase family enzyme
MIAKTYITAPIQDRNTKMIFLGPPGAGKTTMALSLSKMWAGNVFTASSVLRGFIQTLDDPDKAHEINQHFAQGKQYDNVDFYKFLLKTVDMNNPRLAMVDGFPRTEIALSFFLENLLSLQGTHQFILFHVFAPTDICRVRFLSKSPSNSLSVFDSRMRHYQDVERAIIRQLSDMIPTLEIPCFQAEE